MKRNILVPLAAVAILAVGIAIFDPRQELSIAAAAQKAAGCVGWPQEVVTQVESSFMPTRELSDPLAIVLTKATLIEVSRAGTCGDPASTTLSTPAPLRHSPPMAIVPAAQQDYLIIYMGPTPGKGYTFVAGRIGIQSIPSPDALDAEKPKL